MSNLLCCQLMTTCGNPVFCIFNGVSHYPDRFLGLINSGDTQQSNCIIKDVRRFNSGTRAGARQLNF